MSVSFVAGAQGGANATSFNLTWPSVAAGDLAILFWLMQNTGTPVNPTGFTLDQTVDGDTGASRMRFQHKVCDGTETGNLTLDAVVSNRHCAVLAVYHGTHATSPIDTWQLRDESVSGTTHASPQVTTGFPDCVIVTAVGERATTGTSNWTAPSGYNERADSTTASTGSGGTICATADDGLASGRASGSNVTPPVWTSATGFATANVLTWTVSVRPLDQPPPWGQGAGSRLAVSRASSW